MIVYRTYFQHHNPKKHLMRMLAITIAHAEAERALKKTAIAHCFASIVQFDNPKKHLVRMLVLTFLKCKIFAVNSYIKT